MPSEHTYDITTDLGGESDSIQLDRNLTAEGSYTVTKLFYGASNTIVVEVAEDSVSFADLKTALTTASPSMSLDVSSITIVNDNVATGTVTLTDSRGASASGKVVDISWNGVFYADVNSLTLDGSGQGTITLGPCPTTQCTGKGGTLITFSSATESATIVPVVCTVKFQ